MLTRRVGNLTHSLEIQNQIRLLRDQIAHLQLQAATGRRVLSPSDDPSAAANVVQLELALAGNEQFQSSVSQTRAWIDTTENGLNLVQSIVTDTRMAVMQAVNDSQDAESRHAIAMQINELLEELADASRMTENGDHIFSGLSFDSSPYTFALDAEGRITSVAATTDTSGDVERLVGEDLRLTVNVHPENVFGVADPSRIDVFELLVDVRDALFVNDADAVRARLNDFDAAEDQVLVELAVSGATSRRLEDVDFSLEGNDLKLNERISDTQDADLAKTLFELQGQEQALQAALETMSRVTQLSLFDFI